MLALVLLVVLLHLVGWSLVGFTHTCETSGVAKSWNAERKEK